jgi:hypothetical protein
MNKRDSFTEEEEELMDFQSNEECEVTVSRLPKIPFSLGEHTIDCCKLRVIGILSMLSCSFSATKIPGEILLGSGPEADLRLKFPVVELKHAKLKLRDGKFTLKNLAVEHENSTRLEGLPLDGKANLPVGARFSIGERTFCVECCDSSHSTNKRPTPNAKASKPKRQKPNTKEIAVTEEKIVDGFFVGGLFLIKGKTCYWIMRSQVAVLFNTEYSRSGLRSAIARRCPSLRKSTPQELQMITSHRVFNNGLRAVNLISLQDCIAFLEWNETPVPDYLKKLVTDKFDPHVCLVKSMKKLSDAMAQ